MYHIHLLTFIKFSINCHPTDLPRKRQRLSTQSSEDLELQEPVAKKLLHDYTALKSDHLIQDISDLHSESDPEVIIKLLYGNALATISDLLEPHLKAVKKAAGRYNRLGLHHVAVGEDIVESADSIDSLMSRMSVGGMWDQTRFLRKAIASIPQSASDRKVAEAILFHYDQHLAIYKHATLLKDAIPKEPGTEEEAKVPLESTELVPLKITSQKDFDSFSYEDCYILQVRGLKKAFGIPEGKIIFRTAEDGHSTTVTFMIPRQYVHNVIQHSGQLDAVWILLELDIIEVSIPGVFTFIPSVGCFLSLLRGSNPFTADLLGVTEVSRDVCNAQMLFVLCNQCIDVLIHLDAFINIVCHYLMFSIIWEEVGRPLELKVRKKTAKGDKNFDFMEEVLES